MVRRHNRPAVEEIFRLTGGGHLLALTQVLSWRVSNTMTTGFCLAALADALGLHGTPDIFNTGQDVQFTSAVFTGVLQNLGVAIRMDGAGRALDAVFLS